MQRTDDSWEKMMPGKIEGVEKSEDEMVSLDDNHYSMGHEFISSGADKEVLINHKELTQLV